MTTPMARRTFGTADKVRELAERGGALHNLESRQMLEYGISSKRGGLMLKLTTQQYQNLLIQFLLARVSVQAVEHWSAGPAQLLDLGGLFRHWHRGTLAVRLRGCSAEYALSRLRAYAGDGGLATSAELYWPTGVAVDGAGNLYIADGINNRIRKVTAATGIITTVAGNGSASYSGDTGLATSAELSTPSGVAVDSSGNLYIADGINNRIRKVTAAYRPGSASQRCCQRGSISGGV
jgi:hypothetical protein